MAYRHRSVPARMHASKPDARIGSPFGAGTSREHPAKQGRGDRRSGVMSADCEAATHKRQGRQAITRGFRRNLQAVNGQFLTTPKGVGQRMSPGYADRLTSSVAGAVLAGLGSPALTRSHRPEGTKTKGRTMLGVLIFLTVLGTVIGLMCWGAVNFIDCENCGNCKNGCGR